MFTNVAKLTRDGHYVTVSAYSKIHKKIPKTHETVYVYRKKLHCLPQKKAKISKYCNLFPNGECVWWKILKCVIYIINFSLLFFPVGFQDKSPNSSFLGNVQNQTWTGDFHRTNLHPEKLFTNLVISGRNLVDRSSTTIF